MCCYIDLPVIPVYHFFIWIKQWFYVTVIFFTKFDCYFSRRISLRLTLKFNTLKHFHPSLKFESKNKNISSLLEWNIARLHPYPCLQDTTPLGKMTFNILTLNTMTFSRTTPGIKLIKNILLSVIIEAIGECYYAAYNYSENNDTQPNNNQYNIKRIFCWVSKLSPL